MIQVIKYKCCGKVFAACCEPDCYTDKDWLKSLKKYVERGDNIEMVENGTWKFEKCECEKEEEKEEEKTVLQQPNLFGF